MLERRGELAEQLRKLGKLRLASAARRIRLPFEAVQAIDDMDGVVGAALLAVVDDVDAGGLLLRDHIGDRLADGGIERGAASLSREQLFDHLGGARQAAGVGGENPGGAAPHGSVPHCRNI
jgi:hypothetical protein